MDKKKIKSIQNTKQKTIRGTFLTRYKLKKDNCCELVSVKGIDGGKFYVPFEDKEEFFEKYTKFLDKHKNINLALAQKPHFIRPYIIDLDLEQTKKVSNIQDDLSDLKQKIINERNSNIRNGCHELCLALKNIFNEVFTKNEIKKHSKIYISIRPQMKLDEMDYGLWIKDGIHIICPGYAVDKSICTVLNKKLREKIKEIDFFKECLINKLVDPGTAKSMNWTLYGCGKNDQLIYQLNYIFDLSDMSMKNKLETIFPSKSKLIRLFDVQKYTKTSSINKQIKLVIQKMIQEKQQQQNNPIISTNRVRLSDQDIKLIGLILDNLHEKRYIIEKKWTKVGWCLAAISGKDNRIFELWKNFSAKIKQTDDSHKFDISSVLNKWSRANEGFWSMGTLFKWLKKDASPETYKNIQSKNKFYLILKNICSIETDYTLALICSNFLSDYITTKVVTASSFKFKWYKFNEVFFKECIGIPIGLSKLISNTLYIEFINARQYYLSKGSEDMKELDASMDSTEIRRQFKSNQNDLNAKKLFNVSLSLRSHSKKNLIIKELHTFMCDDIFEDTKNKTKGIIVFKNGVYDFKYKKLRMGKHEDKATYSTSCNYISDLSKHKSEIKDLENFMTDIFPDNDIKEFFLDIVSQSLMGTYNKNVAYLCYGEGGTGKSSFFKLLEESLGKYYSTLKTTYFTRRSGKSGDATPEIMPLIDSRIVCASETEKGEVLYLESLKTMTGGNKISGRNLYQGQTEFRFRFTLFFQINDKFKLSSIDRSVRRRFLCIPFEQIFYDPNVDTPEDIKSFKYTKKADSKIDQKIENWASSGLFLTWMIERIKIKNITTEMTLIVPSRIKKITSDYFDENDYFSKFLSETLCLAKDVASSCSKIHYRIIFEKYKTWIRDNGHQKVASKGTSDLKNYLIKNLKNNYNKKTNTVYNHVFVYQSNNDDDYGLFAE